MVRIWDLMLQIIYQDLFQDTVKKKKILCFHVKMKKKTIILSKTMNGMEVDRHCIGSSFESPTTIVQPFQCRSGISLSSRADPHSPIVQEFVVTELEPDVRELRVR